ncbi:MAG: hypothetical protein JWP89_4699 [Schlesneria sp.]|nr:hypothetical protein [Schlesneria sp.]
MMSGRRGWMSVRLSMRLGHRRFVLTFPPTINRWGLVLAMSVLLPVGYFLSAVPTIKLLRRTGLYTPTVESCAMVVYAPLVILDQQSPLCREFFEAEERLLSRVIGD